MIRRYCTGHPPDEWYAAQIPTFLSVAHGQGLFFVDVEISDPAAAEDCDSVMNGAGWLLASGDPVDPLPGLVVGGANGTQWRFDIDQAGTLSLVAYP